MATMLHIQHAIYVHNRFLLVPLYPRNSELLLFSTQLSRIIFR